MNVKFHHFVVCLPFLCGAPSALASTGATCWSTAAAANEVVVSGQSDNAHCPVSLALDGVMYYIEATANRPVISGCLINNHYPTGYTFVQALLNTGCGWGTRGTWYLNRHPASRAFNIATPVNTSYAGSAATTDPDGDTLSYAAYSASQYGGHVNVDSVTGAFTYTPPLNFQAQDWFVIHAYDGKGGDGVIQVFPTVGTPSAQNRPPVFESFTITVPQDQVAGLLLGAQDPEGGPVTIVLDSTLQPQHGTLRPQGPANAYLYRPFAGYFGNDSFAAIARDDHNSATRTVFPIVVVPPPPDVAPSVPGSLNVPATSSTSSYNVSWSAATSNGTPISAYELQESTDGAFASTSLLYSGASLSFMVTGRTNGTYYYRLRACSGTACSNWVEGPTPVVVNIPPNAPSGVSLPSDSTTGSYTVSWSASPAGPTPVVYYELWEADNSAFAGATVVGSGLFLSYGLSGRTNGNYFYQVRACGDSLCSSYVNGGGPVHVHFPPAAPGTLTVPAGSDTGAYTVSWGASPVSPTPVVFYDLWEADNAAFTAPTQVCSGLAFSCSRSGKANGTYYYRVRACGGGACSGYTQAANGVVITLPPGIPSSLSFPSSTTTGSFVISWGAATGTVTSFDLQEALDSAFTSTRTSPLPATPRNITYTETLNDTYYFRVRACNGTACSGWRTTNHGIVVSVPVPGAPPSLTGPATSTGDYTLTWTASTGVVWRYELYETTAPGRVLETLVYSGPGLSRAFTLKPAATYSYRVRACNGNGCSALVSASTGGVVVTAPVAPGAPASITNPPSSDTGSYTVSWSASTGAVSLYHLQEAPDASFSAPVNESTSGTSDALLPRPNGTYYYRVRACNGALCSAWRTSSQPTIVDIPLPGAPPSLTVPPSSTGSYTVSWGLAVGVVTHNQLYESTDAAFTTQTLLSDSWPRAFSFTLSGQSAGVYYYRVRACNSTGCGDYATGSNATVVTP